jgi:lipopolysaccharide biosynthesis regulator YciM
LIEAVYDDVEDWQKAASTFKRLVTEGKQSEARAFADKYAREIALSSTGGSFKQTMGELAKMRRAIQADPELSGTEKRARLTEIDEYQKQLAAQIRELSKQSS